MLQYHALALIIGYVLDLIIGDPHNMPHPIRLIGRWIATIENRIYKDSYLRGILLVIFVLIPTGLITGTITITAYVLSPIIGTVIESIFVFYCLATKSLAVESSAVVKALKRDGLTAARKNLSMIVGRDTENLSEEEVIKATVETVAENTSDGVVAPLLYLCIGGPILGMIYKATNTMDSMVGYKNDRYMKFGCPAAKLDDVLNFIPSRLCAILIIVISFVLELICKVRNTLIKANTNTINEFSGKGAFNIWSRDRLNHKSPNSAQSESAYAGALGLKLAGGAYYFGKWVDKPTIGDALRKIDREDIKRSHILLYGTSILCEVLCTVVIYTLIK